MFVFELKIECFNLVVLKKIGFFKKILKRTELKLILGEKFV